MFSTASNSARKNGTSSLTDAELAGLAVDYIRLNENGKAINVLQPRAARGGFRSLHALGAQSAREPDKANGRTRWNASRIALADFPTSFSRITAPQLAWRLKLASSRDYYLPFLAHRADEARRLAACRRTATRTWMFFFRRPPHLECQRIPLRFVGPDGVYVAGDIDDKERKKLPPDAIAIVQQLVLWHPFDARLYWLLGELYNAEGDVETAFKILDECTNAMAENFRTRP